MIPPSVPMIIVGSLSGLSVGKLFLAGAVPGLLMGFAMMVTTYFIAKKKNFPARTGRAPENYCRRLPARSGLLQ